MAISLEIKTAPARGPGYWKLNNAYLEDEEYFSKICKVTEVCSTLNINSSQ